MSDTLTPSQRHFIAEFVVDRNATQAYLRSHPGASYATARSEGSRLLANPSISQEIAAAARALARSCSISSRKVLRELALIAFADPEDVFQEDPSTKLPVPRKWNTVPPSAKRAIKSIKIKKRIVRSNEDYVEEVEEVEYRFHDKTKALDMLAKHLGLFKESDALAKLLGMLEANSCGPPAPSEGSA